MTSSIIPAFFDAGILLFEQEVPTQKIAWMKKEGSFLFTAKYFHYEWSDKISLLLGFAIADLICFFSGGIYEI